MCVSDSFATHNLFYINFNLRSFVCHERGSGDRIVPVPISHLRKCYDLFQGTDPWEYKHYICHEGTGKMLALFL
jgi:hypothetical protein